MFFNQNELFGKMLLSLAIFLVLFPKTLSSANSVGSVQSLHVTPSVSHGRRSGVMQEKQCFVARLCEYRIDKNHFFCNVSEYMISKAGFERTLPKWLWFDERNKTLKGVASPADEGLSEILIIGLSGQQDGPVGHICGLLTVKIVVWSLRHFPLFAQNFPTSPVINDNFLKTSDWSSISCQFNEPIVLATLVFAGNFHEMGGNEKISVLDGLLQSYHISMYDVFILSNGEEGSLSGLLQTSHVLASGPGSNRSATGPSTTITWHVRCGVIHLDDSLFRAMEKLSQHSALINNVSYGPKGWHVVTGFQKHHVRKRRNIGGTTTPAYSTVPISRATVITTKIKIRRTTSVISPTVTFTWSRPLPTFSSPSIFSNMSLYSQSATVGSRFSNTVTSVSSTSPVMSQLRSVFTISQISPSRQQTTEMVQYTSVSSNLLVMSQSRSVSSISQISPSKRQTTEILQYKSESSTFPMMSQSRKVSLTSQVLPSRQQISEVSHSTKVYPQIHSTSGITRLDNLSTTSQLSSLKLSTFVGPSSTTSENQRSTFIISSSRRDITSSLPQTLQSVISSTSLSPSDVLSKIVSNLFTTGNHLISTSKISNVRSTIAMTTAQKANSTVSTTGPLHPSFGTHHIGSATNMLSSGTYSSVLTVTSNAIFNENISTTVDQMPHESFSSIAHTKPMLSITASPSTNLAGTTQRAYTTYPSYSFHTLASSGSSVQQIEPTATCRNSCEILTSSKNTNITPTIVDEQASTTQYLASSLASERILYSSHLKRTSITPHTSDMDKIPKSTSPTITSGIGIQSYGYNTSKIINTSTSNSTMHSSRLGTRSKETFQTSSTGAMSSQFLSSLFKQTKVPPTSVVNLISTATVKTSLAMPSQSVSRSRSSIFASSTTIFSTATIYTLTGQLRSSTYSSLIKTSPVSTYTSSVQTITVSSQPSISTDISMMVHPTIESTVSYTLTKSSLPSVSWPPQPFYTSRESSRITAILLTRTSIKIPVITSSERLLPSSTSSESSSTAVTLPTTPSKESESPKIYNSFDLLRVSVGKVFEIQIPVDTFHDREDGNTRNLRLELLTVTHARLSSNSWLQFNSTTQTLYGLVLKSQLEVIGSSAEYLLTASDHDGNTVYDAFTVDIEDNAKPLAATFAVKLKGPSLETFNRDLGNILSIVQTIAGYYGDKDESLIQVLSLTEGSVIFTWSNTSLQTCDEDLINDLATKIITRGEIEEDFYNALSPRFTADEVFVNYTGPCILHTTENPSVSELSSHDSSLWLKYVLPALVVVVIMVVIAVACLLVRRHSGVKVLKEDKQIFKRRKPIILDGEREMSTLTGKPIELPEDSLSPVRFARETPFGTPDYYEDDTPKLPSPILPAPSYQRLPPRYSDGQSNRYNTPPPPYKLPPSY